MSYILTFGGLIFGALGTIISIIFIFIFAMKKKEVKKPIKFCIGFFAGGLLLTLIGVSIAPAQQSEDAETEIQENNNNQDSSVYSENKGDIISIRETELYNENGITIIAKSVEDDVISTDFHFVINNNSGKNCYVEANSFSVNGLMASENEYGLSAVEVPDAKKTTLNIKIKNDWLKKNEISQVKKLDVIFWVYNDDSDVVNTDLLSIKTNFDDGKYYEPSGNKIYSDDVIDIWKNDGTTFTIFNKIDKNLSYEFDNCSVNEWSYEITNYTLDLFNEDIHNGSYTVVDFPIDNNFISENNIKSVENIQFIIHFYESTLDLSEMPWAYDTEKISVDF